LNISDSLSIKLDISSLREKVGSSEKIGKDRHDQEGTEEFSAPIARKKAEDKKLVGTEEWQRKHSGEETPGRIINIKV
jgi:hypothetical protein